MLVSAYVGALALVVRGLSPERALLFATLVAGVVGAISIATFDPKLQSDFMRMHDLAVAQATGRDIAGGSYLYRERILLYLLPLYRVFGPHLLAAEIANLLMHLGTAFALYSVVRRGAAGRRGAAFAAIAFLGMPVPYLMINLPTHDIPGLFYLGILFVLVAATMRMLAARRFRGAFALSVLLGVAIVVVDVQRTIGLIVSITLIIFAALMAVVNVLASERESRWRHGAAILVVLGVLPVVFFASVATLRTRPPEAARAVPLRLFATSDMTSDGRWTATRDLESGYFSQVRSTREGWLLALGKVCSDAYYRPGEFVALALRKWKRLLAIGEDQAWVTDADGAVRSANALGMLFASRYWRALLFASAILGAAAACGRVGRNDSMLFPLLFGAAFLWLMLLGETQPRYSFAVHFTIAGLTAYGAKEVVQRCDRWTRPLGDSKTHARASLLLASTGLRRVVAAAVVATALACVAVLGFRMFWSHSSLRLVLLDDPDVHAQCGGAADVATFRAPPRRGFDAVSFGLQLPAQCGPKASAVAHWSEAVAPGVAREVRAFVRIAADAPPSVVVSVSANGVRLLRAPLFVLVGRNLPNSPGERVVHVWSTLPNAPSGRVELELQLERLDEVGPACADDAACRAYLEYVQVGAP